MNNIEFNCIYLGKSKKILSYKNQEHVIPASLGGRKKLSLGMVSDQANEFFSKYEMKAVRDTLLSINRNNNGPGKRGSMSVTKVQNPQINIFENIDDKQEKNSDVEFAPIRLGFMFCGIIHMIPQILFLINDDWSIRIPRIVMDTISENPSISTYDFLMKLNSYILNDKKKYTIIETEIKHKINYINIGMYNNKWFIGSSLKEDKIIKFLDMLKIHKLPEQIPVLPSTESKYQSKNIFTNAFDDSFPWLYMKTAFNTLAFFKDSSFMLNNQFDKIRNAINTIGNMNDFFIEKSMPRWLVEWVVREVKPKEHFVVINAEDNNIEAYISFYREHLSSSIRLSSNYTGKSFRRYVVCNWHKGTEYY